MKTKTRIFSIVIVALALLVALTFVFAGCGKTEKVTLTGSTSVAPLMRKLAAAYEKENKNVRISVGEGGSSQGVKDTQEGKNDIGMASRDLKDTETGLDKVQIAYDGVAVIINNQASIEGNNVTNEQLYALYAHGTPIGSITLPVSREDWQRNAARRLTRKSQTPTETN